MIYHLHLYMPQPDTVISVRCVWNFRHQVWCSAVKYEEGGTGWDLQGGFHASHFAGLLVPHVPFLEVQWAQAPSRWSLSHREPSFLSLEERLTSIYKYTIVHNNIIYEYYPSLFRDIQHTHSCLCLNLSLPHHGLLLQKMINIKWYPYVIKDTLLEFGVYLNYILPVRFLFVHPLYNHHNQMFSKIFLHIPYSFHFILRRHFHLAPLHFICWGASFSYALSLTFTFDPLAFHMLGVSLRTIHYSPYVFVSCHHVFLVGIQSN